jgi:hypothetical protein
MPINITGSFRIQSIYTGDKVAYLTIKDKADGGICKVAHPLPLPKAVVDDGLVKLEGVLHSRLFSNNVGLTFDGIVTALEK